MSEIGSVYIVKHKTDFTLKYYVGSTVNVTNRWTRHKCNCYNINSRDYNVPLYQYIRKHGGIDKFEMEVIYENKPDYKWFESKYIYATFHYNLNKLIPWRTIEEKKQRMLEENRKQWFLSKEKIECKYCKSFVQKNGMSQHQRTPKCRAAQNN